MEGLIGVAVRVAAMYVYALALMRVSGKAAPELLRRVTAVDLDDRFVPQGGALRTSLARVVTDVVRDDVAGRPSYLLHCERLVAGAPPWPDHPSSDLDDGTPNRGEQIHEV